MLYKRKRPFLLIKQVPETGMQAVMAAKAEIQYPGGQAATVQNTQAKLNAPRETVCPEN